MITYVSLIYTEIFPTATVHLSYGMCGLSLPPHPYRPVVKSTTSSSKNPPPKYRQNILVKIGGHIGAKWGYNLLGWDMASSGFLLITIGNTDYSD